MMPKVIYVSEAEDTGENLLSWRKLKSAEEGVVGVYRLVEVLKKRDAVELRRKGSKKWFNPQS